MRAIDLTLAMCLAAACATPSRNSLHPAEKGAAIQAIDKVLDDLHRAAATADGDLYWSLYTPDAIFVGTDDNERWTLEEFQEYADRYFEGDSAWIYHPRERNVSLAPCGAVAWFDEKLDSQNYGAARGSGTLLRANGSWRIAHYVLSFPIPNEIAKQVTDEIKAMEQGSHR